jgi:hypothetical protein
MLNPFDQSAYRDHLPINISKAFEEIGESSCNTESLFGSKSKMLSFSSFSDKKGQKSLLHKSSNEEKSLSVADLASTDTFAISKSSKNSEMTLIEESKSSKPPRVTLEVPKSILKSSERKDKLHCKTCKCLEASNSTIKTLVESESLRLLSKLESLPPDDWKEGLKTTRVTVKKPYTSPLFNNAKPPSQIFRQRINSHILTSRLGRQVSMPVFK